MVVVSCAHGYGCLHGRRRSYLAHGCACTPEGAFHEVGKRESRKHGWCKKGDYAACRWGSAGAWPYVQEINLDANELQGTLPQTWGGNGSMPVIEIMILSRNELTGSIPPSWGTASGGPRFPSLQQLDLLPGVRAALMLLFLFLTGQLLRCRSQGGNLVFGCSHTLDAIQLCVTCVLVKGPR